MSGSANTHARVGSPSDSKRWINCTLATNYEHTFRLGNLATRTSGEEAEYQYLLDKFSLTDVDVRAYGFVEDDSSVYANEGTEAHDWGEKVLLDQCVIEDVPENMREAVKVYVDECKALEADGGMEPFVEAVVPLWYNPERTGTMDYAVVSEERVRVRDYKHGAGVLVDETYNTQLAIYANSFMKWLIDEGYYGFGPDTEVEIGVVQPRHREGDPVRVWTITYRDLEKFCEHIEDAYQVNIAESYEGGELEIETDGVFAPGEACRWCKVKAACAARQQHLLKSVPKGPNMTEADMLEGMPTYEKRGSEGAFKKEHKTPDERLEVYHEGLPLIPVEQLVEIARSAKGIRAWLDDIYELLENRALEGDPAPGTKVVMGRQGNRTYVSSEEAEKILENQKLTKAERTKTVVVSITEAEALIGEKIKEKIGRKANPKYSPRLAKAWEANITRSPARKVMSFEDDPREAVDSLSNEMPDLEEDDDLA